MLTSKQRAFLRKTANSLSPEIHMGKGDMTNTMIKQADDALRVRELIKVRVLETSAIDSKQAAEQMAKETKSQVVQVIGRNFVLFRRNKKDPKIELPR